MPYAMCACGLAKHFVAVSSEAGEFTAYLCEHCDQHCTGCQWCVNLSRSEAKKTDR